MTYDKALEALKRGKMIRRNKRSFILLRGIIDVTDPQNHRRVSFFEPESEGDQVVYENFEDWKKASDWEIG
jgi:hypothetical protein